MLRKSPAFTVAAVLTLALGIGLNAAVFSAVHALLFRPLPGVAEPDRLVQLYRTHPGGFDYGSSSVPHYFDVRERSDVFTGVAAWRFLPVSISADGRSERLSAQMVSANFFSVLGVTPAAGRTFVAAEDEGPGAHAVIVLGHAFWQERFGGDPAIVGRSVVLNGRPFTVVGVAPQGFRGPIPIAAPALWVPLMMQNEIMPGGNRLDARGSNFLSVLARLAPDVTIEQAQQGMNALNAGLAEEHPGAYEGSGMLLVAQDEANLGPQVRSAQVGLSAVMMVVVGLLLLIACVNVANLFLARARERRREMAIRLSLGAPRGRLIRQLMSETLLFSLLAGSCGLLVAYGTLGILNGIQPPFDVPIRFDFRLDTPVLVFAAAVTLAAGMLFGLVPALQSSRPRLVTALKGDTEGSEGRRSRLTQTLVVVQMALSLVLLVGAGLFLRNLQDATSVDTGFASGNLLLAATDPGLQGYDRERADVFYRELVPRVRSLPGVRAAALAEMVPLGLSSQQYGITVPGYVPAANERMNIDYNIVGPGYFETMDIPLRGRGFLDRDSETSRRVIVVNERMARRFWPGEDAIGRVVELGGYPREVVGVAADGKYGTLGEDPLAFMYLPQAQQYSYAMTFHVRTDGDPLSVLPAIREAVAQLDPNLPVYDVRSMEQHLGLSLLPARLAGTVLGIFGGLGLVLAAVGIYGVMAQAVSRRRREIGLRLALGARRDEVVGMVLRQGFMLALLGVSIALPVAFAASRLIRGLLYSNSTIDPFTYLSVPAILLGVALVATYLPARRAAAIEPMQALKSD